MSRVIPREALNKTKFKLIKDNIEIYDKTHTLKQNELSSDFDELIKNFRSYSDDWYFARDN